MPSDAHSIRYSKAAMVWDEALPLGNGNLGALLWGDGSPVHISLDRTDLWDSREVPEFSSEEYDYKTLVSWVDQRKSRRERRLYEKPYTRPAPSKIPAGRILIEPSGSGSRNDFLEAGLDIQEGVASIRLKGERSVSCRVHALEPLGIIEMRGCCPRTLELAAPAFSGRRKISSLFKGIDNGAVSGLGYNAPRERKGDNWAGYVQDCREDWSYAVYLEGQDTPEGWIGAWTICTSHESEDPEAEARSRVRAFLEASCEDVKASHRAWWKEYWEASSLSVPDKSIERQYYLDMYKFGAAGRKGHPPIALQGPWTADNGKLPPWKGDYHHDLNTELCYWPAYTGNRLEEGRVLIDWLWDTRDNCRSWTRRFFKKPGLNVPMTADIFNRQIGGWRQYTHSATTACWLSQHFYLHWQFSGDRRFLEERAYPYMKESAVFIEAMTGERATGALRSLPLSASPEINDNKHSAWFRCLTNYDLSLMRFLFTALEELAGELSLEDDRLHWKQILSEFPELAMDERGKLLIAPETPLPGSHRHFSHLMSIHPLGILDISDGESAKNTIVRSLDELYDLGPSQWTGYSYSWLANLEARAGRGEKAAKALSVFAEAFVLRSSFHCNGDQSGKGYSSMNYRPFTLEGNFAYAAGLQEMLLQSHRGYIELFPAVPDSWQDLSFRNLRARGGILVSAERRGGALEKVVLYSEKDCSCRILSPRSGKIETLQLKGGETLSL